MGHLRSHSVVYVIKVAQCASRIKMILEIFLPVNLREARLIISYQGNSLSHKEIVNEL